VPGQSKSNVQQRATGRGGQEGAQDPDNDDRYEGGPQPRPSDVPAAIEKDQHERHRDDLLDRIVPHRRRSRDYLDRDGSSGQHPDRGRNSESRRQAVDQDGRQCNGTGQGDDQGVLGRVGQVLLLGDRRAEAIADQPSRHTDGHTTPHHVPPTCQLLRWLWPAQTLTSWSGASQSRARLPSPVGDRATPARADLRARVSISMCASLGCMSSPIDAAHIDSPDAVTPRARSSQQRRGWWSRMAPVLLLLLVAPLVAEFLLGDVSLALLGALVVFIPLYGGGWPAIVVLAAAFGV